MRRLARLFAELPPTENANAASPSTLCGRLRAPISDRACPILFTGQRSKPSPFVRFSLSIIRRSVSCPIFLSTRKNSFVALTKVSREKRYFDCESFFSFSFAFFPPFFKDLFYVRLTSIICSIIVKIVRLSSRLFGRRTRLTPLFLNESIQDSK